MCGKCIGRMKLVPKRGLLGSGSNPQEAIQSQRNSAWGNNVSLVQHRYT